VGHTGILLGGTIDTFVDMVFNYPSLSETYKYAAYEALGQVGDTPDA
jgi:NAD(P) transhydrogenase